ncbi:MAG: DNA polymerase III subunit alpha, partial [Chloroflexota bacterium]
AGVVISRDPLVEHVPVQRAGGKSEGDVTTQFPMGQLEDLGLLKMDFLGLKTLTVLGKTVELLRDRGIEIDLESVPLDDPRAYEALRRGETFGVFQLEGGMTTRMTIDVAPDGFEDLIALMALIRPGPMEMAPDYISRKHGRTPIEYMHPELEPILAETYGVALYQEQVMQIANTLAGFSMAEGDGLRKAMGKKLPEEMAKYRDRFIAGCVEHGVEQRLAGDIFDMIERFAGYGFNKAHSAAYAVIAAQTAYFKAAYPVEYLAASLCSELGNTDRVVSLSADARRANVPMLPPDINRSGVEFRVEELPDGILGVRWGLAAVKNAGEGAVAAIVEARATTPDGAFNSLEEFCETVDWSTVNRRVVESLAKVGALDCFGPRGSVIEALEESIAAGQRLQKASAKGQMGLFDVGGTVQRAEPRPLPASNIPQKQLLQWEKELLGTYMSAHPLQQVLSSRRAGTTLIELADRTPGQMVRPIVMVSSVRRVTTKNNRTMAILEVEDLTGSAEVVAFPETYDRLSSMLFPDAIVELTGKIDLRNDRVQLILEDMTEEITPQVAAAPPANIVHVVLSTGEDQWSDIRLMNDVDAALRAFEGDEELVLHVPGEDGRVVQMRSRSRRVHWCPELVDALSSLPGVLSVRLEEPRLAAMAS